MNALVTFDIRGCRLSLYLDGYPSHPFDLTDAPFEIYSYRNGRDYWPGHSIHAVPDIGRHGIGIYFKDEGKECSKDDSEGCLYVDKRAWLAYAGAPATLKMLRGQLAELRAYWQGEVFGFRLTKTFKHAGRLYDSNEEVDSCWGFYGRDGVLSSMPQYITSPALRTMLRKWTRANL